MQICRNHRGLRHYWGLRVRGQHTKTTGRRGKTVGVSKKRWGCCPSSSHPSAWSFAVTVIFLWFSWLWDSLCLDVFHAFFVWSLLFEEKTCYIATKKIIFLNFRRSLLFICMVLQLFSLFNCLDVTKCFCIETGL